MKKAFIFPGQGSQIIGMAKEFYDNFNVSKVVFEEVDEALDENLTKIIFEGSMETLTITSNAQPAIMTASIAILEAIKSETGLSIEKLCDFTAGHSLGEYTALCACGALTLRDTAKLLKIRGDAFLKAGEKNTGCMAVIGAPVDIVEEIVKKSTIDDEILEITNDNTSEQCVLSGNLNSIDRVLKVAGESGIKKVKKLTVSGAFHSKLMEPAVSILTEVLSNISIYEPKVPIVSNYTAQIEKKDEIKENLIKQVVNKVRWRETMLNLESSGVELFVEVGAVKILSNMVRKTCQTASAVAVNSIKDMIDIFSL